MHLGIGVNTLPRKKGLHVPNTTMTRNSSIWPVPYELEHQNVEGKMEILSRIKKWLDPCVHVVLGFVPTTPPCRKSS